ncbi:hypothetical protein GLOIN_2v1790230 [Rhizophagus clarus]|uniref:Uncharacterized protein n=1 Tax=Rhizophagus clarus TaxID=94130 RepID=A0A8H3LBI6_9GLOM|nr:hypothetical protein GLOIN_2v1790230 [Rhizophagus clarus]
MIYSDCIHEALQISRTLLSGEHKLLNIDVGTNEIGLELMLGCVTEIAELRKKNDKIPVLEKKFAEVEAENARLKQIIEENARRDAENAELKSRVGELEARLALLEQGSAVDGMALSFGQTQNDEEAMPVVTVPTVDVPDSDMTKIPEITDMLTLEQDEQDLSQSYEASSESIRSASCDLSKQPQVNASKLTCNLKNCEDSLQSELCNMEEHQHDEVIVKLNKNIIIVKQELKQQIDNLVAGKIKKKTATSEVYQEIKWLLPDITDVNLHQKILRARKSCKLFNILGINKIKQVSYNANAILSFNTYNPKYYRLCKFSGNW